MNLKNIERDRETLIMPIFPSTSRITSLYFDVIFEATCGSFWWKVALLRNAVLGGNTKPRKSAVMYIQEDGTFIHNWIWIMSHSHS